ncbi:putative Integrase family protein [Nitrolancea hollandica Lb]|uniref:Putative Integrase family protein n=2 Tax=Nitrolancea hollandica TaxID=1206749 RepID=I4EKZ4_9BACT|nr:putative Integrase family protein [Nitrolancea hollandica Lb]
MGRGSIYQRKDGRWVAAVMVEGRRVSRYRKTQAEAEQALTELLTATATVTLADWAEEWLQSRQLRPSTQTAYRKALKPVLTKLGKRPLSELTPLRLVRFFNRRRAETGPRSVQETYAVLRTCLEGAVSLGLLATNPMAKVPKPQWSPSEKIYWTVEETRRFLETALRSNRRWSGLCAFLVVTGLRISEALALEWGDVRDGQVTIKRALVAVNGAYVLGPPKSKAGWRTVALDSTGEQILARLERGSGRLFVTKTGKSPMLGTIHTELTRLCDEAQVPQVSPHGLRHVHAALVYRATRDPYLTQRRLGHSHVSTTLGIYGYSTDGDQTVAKAVDRLLGGDHD